MTCGKKILKQGEVEDEVDVDGREQVTPRQSICVNSAWHAH